MKDEKKIHEGHRTRILTKLKNNDLTLEDHEILEILLFNALPRKDTNLLAHCLLDAFGNIEGIFKADIEELMQVKGIGQGVASYLKCIGLFYQKYSQKEISPPVSFESNDFRKFIIKKYSPLTYEQLDFYCLNKDMQITLCKSFTQKNKERVEVTPIEVTKFITTIKPYALILVHNHIDSHCFPSEKDDDFTAQCQIICSINNVRLLDHYIYGKNEVFSYYFAGKIKTIYEKYSINNILGK